MAKIAIGLCTLLGVAFTAACTPTTGAQLTPAPQRAEPDAFSWLDERRSPRVDAWLSEQNTRTAAQLERDPRYSAFLAQAERATLQSEQSALAYKEIAAGFLYDVFHDEQHPRGLLRRTPLDQYIRGAPVWQNLLDVDRLSADEGALLSVHVQGTGVRDDGRRGLLVFTEGAASRGSYREYDFERRAFVVDGFNIAVGEAHNAEWRDDDSIYVTDTTAHDGRVSLRVWRRGEPLSRAQSILELELSEPDALFLRRMLLTNAAGAPAGTLHLLEMQIAGGNYRYWASRGSDNFTEVHIPQRGRVYGAYCDELIIQLRADVVGSGQIIPAGSIVSTAIAPITSEAPTIHVVHAPGTRERVLWPVVTRDGVLVPMLRNVNGEMIGYRRTSNGWAGERADLPSGGSLGYRTIAHPLRSEALLDFQSFLAPSTTYALSMTGAPRAVRAGGDAFSSAGLVVEQRQARSADGTMIPYFVVRARNAPMNGQTPTIITGYGASRSPETPMYDPHLGQLWLERGGAFVMANIRGGGEFGESWFVRGLERRRVYEDFTAVAEDVIQSGLTSPRRLGFRGMSSGGLLGGVMITQRPDLFNAAVLEVPVLDQFRLDHLSGGGSEGYNHEFGDLTDPAVRAFIAETSPFQNVRTDPTLPAPLIITSTTDDNVHPAHARRFAAKAQALGHQIWFMETSEGGHGMATTPEQRARIQALIYIYFTQRLMDSEPERAP